MNEQEINKIIGKYYPAQSYKRMRLLAKECYDLGFESNLKPSDNSSSKKDCPKCHNHLFLAGNLENVGQVYYCKVCNWRGSPS